MGHELNVRELESCISDHLERKRTYESSSTLLIETAVKGHLDRVDKYTGMNGMDVVNERLDAVRE